MRDWLVSRLTGTGRCGWMSRIISYQVIRGTLREHVPLMDTGIEALATQEARMMNEAYQTDEYRVLTLDEDGNRRILK